MKQLLVKKLIVNVEIFKMIKKILANENVILSEKEKNLMIEKVELLYGKILEELKFDVKNDQQIKETPHRWAKMMVNELLSGCYNPPPKITVFDNTKNYDQMVFNGPIKIMSMCSHHFQNFIGQAYIGYIPGNKVVGISKLSRIVKWFMRRPQIQEELTKQIADYLENILKPKGLAVFFQATHLCMVARGVEESQEAKMQTCDLRGYLKDHAAKNEFLNMISLTKK